MKINYKRELETAAKNMILVHDPDVLIRMIVRMIVHKVKLAHAGILLYDKNKDTYILTVSGGHVGVRAPAGFLRMDPDSPLIRFFRTRKAKEIFGRGAFIYDAAKKKLKQKLSAPAKALLKGVLSRMQALHAVACIPSYFRDELMAVVLLGEKKNGRKFAAEEMDFFIALSFDMAMAIRNAWLFQELETELAKKYRLLINTILSLAQAIDAKDHYTHGHTARVTSLSLAIAKRLQKTGKNMINQRFLEDLNIASLLHDIGKIGIPEIILNKNGTLTGAERKKMEEHTLLGSKILSPIAELENAILGVKCHHERFDGSGYPQGLKAEQIPFIASVISVADTFDAMTTDRPYHQGLSKDEAVQEIIRLSGKQFDPRIVDAFAQLYREGKI